MDFATKRTWRGGHYQRKAKGLARGRHETLNRRFKQWQILSQRYRHDLNLHGKIFRAIAAITQIDIRAGNPPFQVEYRTLETEKEKAFRLQVLRNIRNNSHR